MVVHGDSSCAEVGKMGKADQRAYEVTTDSFSAAVAALKSRSFQLGASAAANDLWLHIDFDDAVFEGAVAGYILRQLGARYTPLQGVQIKKHC
jgi:hypothetical protein